jgi:hypothetical protein
MMGRAPRPATLTGETPVAPSATTTVLEDAIGQLVTSQGPKTAQRPPTPSAAAAAHAAPNQFQPEHSRFAAESAPMTGAAEPQAANSTPSVVPRERAASGGTMAGATEANRGAGTVRGRPAGLAQLMRGAGSADAPAPRSPPVVVESPDRASLWQIGPDRSILRYTTGRGWEPQASGAGFPLVAGSAPSKIVCWAVGRSGTIVETTNGENWKTINSPTGTDLISVAATSALDATITSAKGRKFVTTDGGLSWRPE